MITGGEVPSNPHLGEIFTYPGDGSVGAPFSVEPFNVEPFNAEPLTVVASAPEGVPMPFKAISERTPFCITCARYTVP